MARRKRSGSSKKSSGGNTDYGDIVDRITPVADVESYPTVVTYGRSGTGKTTFASTFPKPMLLLDVKDEGTDSVKDVEEIEVLSIETFEDYQKIYWYLKSGDHEFKSVHIDTITQVQDKIKDHVVGPDATFVSQQQWGEISGLMKTWTMNFRDLADDGIVVHFLAQDRLHESNTDEDEDGQIDPEVGPWLMPSVAKMLNAAVKFIGNTYISEQVERSKEGIERAKEYRLRIGPHPYYITKARKPKDGYCPEFLINPSYDDIIAIRDGKYTDESSKPKKKSSGKKKSTSKRRKK